MLVFNKTVGVLETRMKNKRGHCWVGRYTLVISTQGVTFYEGGLGERTMFIQTYQKHKAKDIRF